MTTKAKRRMPQPGEYMPINWDSTPDEEYVRGHVTPEDFAAAYDLHASEPTDPRMPAVPVRHEYARWSAEATEDGPGLVLRTYKEPGPGRFPITAADYRAVQHAWWNARREAAEAAQAS